MAKKKEKTGLSDTKKDEILLEAVEQYDTAISEDQDERRKADDDVKFAINNTDEHDASYPGHQWDRDVSQKRTQALPPRPCLVMNKIPEKIDQVEGEFRKLKPSIKIKPVDNLSDPISAEIISGVIRHIEYNSNARSAYNTAHSSVLHCGRGAWRIDIEESQDDPFENDIVINRIPDVFSVTWDPNCKKLDKSDGKFWFITEDIPIKEFEKKYPGVTLSDWPTDGKYKHWKNEKTIRVAEYWWKEPGTKTAYAVFRGGNRMTVWDPEPEDEIVASKEVNHDKVMWCKMVATEIIDGPYDDFPSKYIPIVVEVGKEVHIGGKQKTRGMVRFAKEPQRMYNYWTSSEAEQLGLATKAPWLLTPTMMGAHKNQWDNANNVNYSALFYEADPKFPGVGPKKIDPPQMSSGYVVGKQSMEQDIMSSMNIYKASLGDAGNEVSGIAIEKRQRQGNVGAYTYNDHFEVALTYSAKILVDIIPREYNNERLIRIRGEAGDEKLVPINARPGSPAVENARATGTDEKFLGNNKYSDYINDLSVGKYDVRASIGKNYDTQREEALDVMVGLLEVMPKVADVAPDLILGLLDIPMSEELMERVKKLVPPEFRKLEPGEELPEEKPTPEQMINMKNTEIKFQDQQRKDFETSVSSLETLTQAILNLAKAEAEEPGPQYEMYKQWTADLGTVIEDLKGRQASMAQPQPIEGPPPGAAQGVI